MSAARSFLPLAHKPTKNVGSPHGDKRDVAREEELQAIVNSAAHQTPGKKKIYIFLLQNED